MCVDRNQQHVRCSIRLHVAMGDRNKINKIINISKPSPWPCLESVSVTMRGEKLYLLVGEKGSVSQGLSPQLFVPQFGGEKERERERERD